jgi:hypothetical protein
MFSGGKKPNYKSPPKKWVEKVNGKSPTEQWVSSGGKRNTRYNNQNEMFDIKTRRNI